MNLFRSLLEYCQKYELVQNMIQVRQHLSGSSIFSSWYLYPKVYSILHSFTIPSHQIIQKNAQILLGQGHDIGDLFLAQSLLLQNQLDAAEYHITRFLKKQPKHANGIYLLAEIKKRQSRRVEAFALLERVLAHSKRRKTWQHLSNLVEEPTDFFRFYGRFTKTYPGYRQEILPYDLSCHLCNAAVRAKNTAFVLDFWRQQYRLLKQQNLAKSFAKMPVSRRYSDVEAAKALGDLKKLFDQKQIEFFLISGTLLGCVREGKLLGHDKDIDLGVWEMHTVKSLAEVVQDSGCFYVLPIYSPDILVVRHVNGVTIDIFIHHREKDDYWHAGGKSKWHNSPFELISYPFLNDKYLIPKNYDLYLTENYGDDWRVPKISFDSALDTPNMEIISQDEFLIYLYKKVVFALHFGRQPSQRYLNVLREYGEILS